VVEPKWLGCNQLRDSSRKIQFLKSAVADIPNRLRLLQRIPPPYKNTSVCVAGTASVFDGDR
jgi:hypothetical protein